MALLKQEWKVTQNMELIRPHLLIGGKRIKTFEFEKLDKAIQQELK